MNQGQYVTAISALEDIDTAAYITSEQPSELVEYIKVCEFVFDIYGDDRFETEFTASEWDSIEYFADNFSDLAQNMACAMLTYFDKGSCQMSQPRAAIATESLSWQELKRTNQENDYQDLVLYPNPVKDYFIIAGDYRGELQIEIISLDGRVLSTSTCLKGQNSCKISTLDLPSGVYFVKLKDLAGKNKTLQFAKF